MIRFSAALVAVAIGVLIGGVATSKLLLVYIAIVLSAVALVALAIGVLLNREELFGEKEQGLAPVAAGASPVPSARSGESQEKIPPGARVAPPPPLAGAAGGYVGAFSASAPAAPSSAGADLSAARPALAVQGQSVPGRSADPVPPWETQEASSPWSSSAPDRIPGGQRKRAASGAGARAQSQWQDTAPGAAPGGRGNGWGVTGADTRPAPAMPRSWAAPPSSPLSADPATANPLPGDAPAVKPSAAPGSAPPSWFDRLGNPAVAKSAGTSTPAPGSGSSRSWSNRGSSAAGGTAAAQDTAALSEPDGTDAEPESEHPASVGTAAGMASGAGSEDIAPVKPAVPGDSDSGEGTDDKDKGDEDAPQPAPPTVAAPVITATAASEPVGTAEDADADVADSADHSDEADSATGSEPPASLSADAAPATALVTVVPGVPRYHEQDCVLIRFMPDDDVRKLTIPQAKEEGCTPCAACQPEG